VNPIAPVKIPYMLKYAILHILTFVLLIEKTATIQSAPSQEF